MREIKYRAKEKDTNQWVYGYYIFDGQHKTHCMLINKNVGDFIETDFAIVILETVGQFTGLCANGKEIYEGDIVQSIWKSHVKGVVKFGTYVHENERGLYSDLQQGFYVLDNYDKDNTLYGFGDNVWFEVIGNIHDNQDLLEVQE